MRFNGPGDKDATKRPKDKGWASEKDSGEGAAKRTGRRVSGLIVGIGAERNSIERTGRNDADRAVGSSTDRGADRRGAAGNPSRSTDRSPSRSPDRSPDRSPSRSPDRSPDRSPSRSPDAGFSRSNYRGEGRRTDRNEGRSTADSSLGRGGYSRSDRSAGRSADRSAGRSEGRSADAGFSRSNYRGDGRSADTGAGRSTGRSISRSTGRSAGGSFISGPDRYKSFGGATARSDGSNGINRGPGERSNISEGQEAGTSFNRYDGRGRNPNRNTGRDFGGATGRNPSRSFGNRMDKDSDRGAYKGVRRGAGSSTTGSTSRYKARDTGRDTTGVTGRDTFKGTAGVTGRDTLRETRVDAGWRSDRNPSGALDADDRSMDVIKHEVQETENVTDASRTPGYIPDEIIEGRNPVIEALKAGRTINKILVAKGEKEGSIKQVIAIAKENGVIVQEVSRIKLDNMSATHGHQGVMALISARDYADFDEMVQAALSSEKQAFILILDGIEDPYNLGSIIRTADAAGVQGIVIPKRRAVGLTGAVAKASAGAIEYVPVARVTNIAVCIDQLKEKRFWIAGADSVSGEELSKVDLKGPIALVIGGEDSGLGRLVREKCDYVLHIPMKGRISSLNTSVAAGIIMYEIVRQRMSG